MANFLLERMVPLKPYILPVNPFNDHKDARSNLAGFKKTLEHLRMVMYWVYFIRAKYLRIETVS